MAKTTILKLTVAQILNMYSDGKLHFDQSTQRGFIYNDDADYAKSKEDPELSCAGDVIKTILNDGFISPVVFFHTDDMAEDEFNVHDGKQRLSSVIEFIQGNVVTKLDETRGSELMWGNLLDYHEELAVKLLEFEFDIQVRYGTASVEERSFFKTNTTGLPLTVYEGLRGSYHGKFFDTFEEYMKRKHLILPDIIKPIGRGLEAIWWLYLALGCIDTDKTYTASDPRADQLLNSAKTILARCRDSAFDPTVDNFEEKVTVYARLVKEGRLHKTDVSKQAAKVYRLANYIVDMKYNQELIIGYFRKYNTDAYPNDIGSWKFNKEIKHAIKMLTEGKTPDPLRYFGNWKPFKQQKSELWASLGDERVCPGYTTADGVEHKCGHTFANIDDSEMDHDIPYDLGMELGGTTTMDNCVLICKHCNTEKKNK
jgi:hypothetical protein